MANSCKQCLDIEHYFWTFVLEDLLVNIDAINRNCQSELLPLSPPQTQESVNLNITETPKCPGHPPVRVKGHRKDINTKCIRFMCKQVSHLNYALLAHAL